MPGQILSDKHIKHQRTADKARSNMERGHNLREQAREEYHEESQRFADHQRTEQQKQQKQQEKQENPK